MIVWLLLFGLFVVFDLVLVVWWCGAFCGCYVCCFGFVCAFRLIGWWVVVMMLLCGLTCWLFLLVVLCLAGLGRCCLCGCMFNSLLICCFCGLVCVVFLVFWYGCVFCWVCGGC